MNAITPELRLAIERAGEAPVRLEDSVTNQSYFLVKAEVYERIRALLDDDITPEDRSRHLWEVMKDEWSDPSMDVYDSEEYA